MSERTIRVAEETWQALQRRSLPDETLDATITRLLEVSDRVDDPEWTDEVIDEAVTEMQSELEDGIEDA